MNLQICENEAALAHDLIFFFSFYVSRRKRIINAQRSRRTSSSPTPTYRFHILFHPFFLLFSFFSLPLVFLFSFLRLRAATARARTAFSSVGWKRSASLSLCVGGKKRKKLYLISKVGHLQLDHTLAVRAFQARNFEDSDNLNAEW